MSALVRPVTQRDRPRGSGATIGNDIAKAAIWAFYQSQGDRVVVKVAFIKVRVRDLKVLFEMLAGPEPT